VDLAILPPSGPLYKLKVSCTPLLESLPPRSSLHCAGRLNLLRTPANRGQESTQSQHLLWELSIGFVALVEDEMAREPMVHPPGWDSDTLSTFLEDTYRNCFAGFYNKKDDYRRLAWVDDCFTRVQKDWIKPGKLLAPHFLIRSHSAFRAACEHALSGQASETYPLVRVCLENSGYALLMHENYALTEKWVRRHDSVTALKEARRQFKHNRCEAIRRKNRKSADVFDNLYQRSVDFGAHPNERSLIPYLAD
jgi:hypothetical protein